jgi:hypothetical protein
MPPLGGTIELGKFPNSGPRHSFYKLVGAISPGSAFEYTSPGVTRCSATSPVFDPRCAWSESGVLVNCSGPKYSGRRDDHRGVQSS